MTETLTYKSCCKACHGEGTTEEVVSSYSGVGGYTTTTRACYSCKGTGEGELVTIEADEDPEPEPPAPAAPVLWNGGLLEAPGFTTETFIASLERATKRGFCHIHPGRRAGLVVVTSASGNTYEVTRQDCTCQGHLGHGYCQHRAAAIAVADLWGLPICQIEIIGFDREARPLLADEQLQGVA